MILASLKVNERQRFADTKMLFSIVKVNIKNDL